MADSSATDRKPRVTRDKRMVRQIRVIMDEFEAAPDGTHTTRSLINYLADIADVLDEVGTTESKEA